MEGSSTAAAGHRPWMPMAWLLLGVARLAVLVLPFRRLAVMLGGRQVEAPWLPLVDAETEAQALRLGRAIRSAARYTPWSSNCFAQAITARILLGLHGIPHVIFFGVSRERDRPGMVAHAWVIAGRIRVTGGDGFARHTVVASFFSQAPPASA